MARGKKGIDGVDRVVDLFPAGSAKMIDRLLRRAAEKEAKKAGRDVKRSLQALSSGGRAGNRMIGGLARELGKALRHRGDVGAGRASVRQKAPDTGGRPFHFAHSHVTKGDVPPAAGSRPAAGGKTGRAAAHMRYIEREIAVERLVGMAGDRGIADAAAEIDGTREAVAGKDEGRGLDGPDHVTGAAPAQGYIENPTKLENGEQVIFSFGTIGDRFEDRVAFWEALEQAEARDDARVQQRLIVELPHESSPQARFEMVKALCRRFEDDGVPYWAALHAPGAKNDSRNFHAHVVFSERPAKRIVDPESGKTEWDFAITRTYVDSSRHRQTSRPYRQTKLRTYTAKAFIPSLRKDFSDAVNVILARDNVRSDKGEPVRYDARSYKDMGLDVVPMRSINRIVADKMKQGAATILDGDYTKRMIATELREAAARRDKGLMELVALDDLLRETTTAKSPNAKLRKLPKELRGSTAAIIPRPQLKTAGNAILEARRSALQVDVMEKATTASLERVIAATAPKVVAAATASRDPVKRAGAPSEDAAAMLHAAAIEELAATKASAAAARRTARYAVGRAMNAWKALVDAPMPTTSAATKAAIEWATAKRPPSPAAVVRPTPSRARPSARKAPTQGRRQTAPSQEAPSRPSPSPFYEGMGEEPHIFEQLKMPKVLLEVSASISRMIRAVTANEPDVEKRMDAIELLDYDLRVAHRARQGPRPPGSPPLPPIERTNIRAAVPFETGLPEEVFAAQIAARDAVARHGTDQTTPTGPATTAARPEAPPTSPTAPSPEVAKSVAPSAAAPPPTRPDPPSAVASTAMEGSADIRHSPASRLPQRSASTQTPRPDDRQPDQPGLGQGPRVPHPPPSSDERKDETRDRPPAAPPAEPAEHPADTKRREAFEREEKRKRRRRAVLARRNRGGNER